MSAGRGQGGGPTAPRVGRKRPAVQFKVVQQSYEDKDYEQSAGPKPVLVPAASVDKRYKAKLGGRQAAAAAHDEDDEDRDFLGFANGGGGTLDLNKGMPEDFTQKRNMLMADDTQVGEEKLFADQVECEFDEKFIQEMMYGEGGNDDDDDDEDDSALGDEKYPRHDTSQRAIDKQFMRMMREFDADEDINDPEVSDPRAMGPLEVHQYMNALEEFIEENAGISYDTAEPLKNKGLIHQLKHMALKRGVFDSNKNGVFVTTLLPDKKARFVEEYRRETEELKALALQRAQAREQRMLQQATTGGAAAAAAEPEDEAEAEVDGMPRFEIVEMKEKEVMDCETVLSTYSTLYNHPNIIAAARKKVDPSKVVADERRRRQKAAQELQKIQQQQHRTQASDDDGVGANARDDDSADGAAFLDLSERPKDESPEEKKLRRQMVKQQQRERRVQKKELRAVYKDCAVKQTGTVSQEKQKKAQMSLSLVKGWA